MFKDEDLLQFKEKKKFKTQREIVLNSIPFEPANRAYITQRPKYLHSNIFKLKCSN